MKKTVDSAISAPIKTYAFVKSLDVISIEKHFDCKQSRR